MASLSRIDRGRLDRWISRIQPSAHDDGRVYLTMTGYRYDEFTAYVYRSDDYGTTWTSLASTLPAEPVNVIAEDPSDARILYLGTDTGVYVSLDGGGRWVSLCAGLPTTPVYDLVVHPREGELIIGTHGRSVFVADIKPVRAAVAGR